MTYWLETDFGRVPVPFSPKAEHRGEFVKSALHRGCNAEDEKAKTDAAAAWARGEI